MAWEFLPLLLQGAMLLIVVERGECFSNGTSAESCNTLSPDPQQYGAQPNSSDNPFFIDLRLFETDEGVLGYVPGNAYTITLRSNSSVESFRGFFIQARQADDDATVLGRFTILNPFATRLGNCSIQEGSVTHNASFPRPSETFVWTAPPAGSGDIWFRFFVVQTISNYWADQRTAVIAELPPVPFVEVGIERESYTAFEGGVAQINYTFLSNFTSVNGFHFVFFDVEVVPVTATESDYSLLGSFGVIASISTVPFSQITISIQNDIEMEDNEEFIVRVIPRMGQFSGNLVFTRNFTTVTISNSTEIPPIEVGFVQDNYTVTEGESVTLTYAILSNISQVGDSFVNLQIDVIPGTATTADFNSFFNRFGFLSQFTTTNSITIVTTNDTITEGDEEFTVRLSIRNSPGSPTGNFVITQNVTVVTIRDINTTGIPPIEVGFVQDNFTVTEGGRVTIAYAILSNISQVSTNYFVSLQIEAFPGTATASDYSTSFNSFGFLSRFTTTNIVTIGTINDFIYEGDEEFTVSLTIRNGTGSTNGNFIITQNVTTVIIADNDIAGTPALSIAPTFVEEGENFTACVTIAPAPENETFVSVFTSNFDAVGGRDFSPINQTLTFGPELPTQQCLEIVTYLDSVLEFRESIQVIATIDGGNIPNSPTTGLIINSDTFTIGFELTEYSFREDAGGAEVCVVIEEGGIERFFGVQLRISFIEGTATVSDNDFDGFSINIFTLTLTSNTPERVCAIVPITPDDRRETDEYFLIFFNQNPEINFNPMANLTNITILNDDCETLSDPPYGQVILSGTTNGSMAMYVCDSRFVLTGDATRVCQDDGYWSGEEPVCQISTLTLNPFVVTEGDMMIACVSFMIVPSAETPVLVFTRDLILGGATSGIDYNSINQSLVFGPDLPTQQCINISTIADSLAEHTELFEVMATMNGSNIEASPVLAHIISSDVPSFTLSSPLVSEGDTVQACVTLQIEPMVEMIIHVSTRDSTNGAAVGGLDYTAINASLTFGPGLPLVGCLDIGTHTDSVLEPLEVFEVVATVNGNDFEGSPAFLVILSSDTFTVGFEQTEYTFREDDGGEVCVVLEEGGIQGDQSVELTLRASDGTATAFNEDYNMLAFMFLVITITSDTPTEGVCFTVPISPDSQHEEDEYFLISLNENPLVNLSPSNNQTNVTILNDDCETLSSPFGGQVIMNGTAAGSIATYICDPDSELIGNVTRVCQIDGTWSGEEPLCQGLLYPFGDVAGDLRSRRSDDGGTGPIPLVYGPLPYFGTNYSSIYINNNGPLTFTGLFSDFSPEPFPEGRVILTAFWDDININRGGDIFYRVTQDPVCLERARLDILVAGFAGAEDLNPTYLFIATWYQVVEFGGSSSQRNTFQLVLASDRERSFAIFLYEEINFGPGAVAGFDAGDGRRFYNIPATFQNLDSTSNVNRTGVYIFRIDSNNIIFPFGCESLPSIPNGQVSLSGTSIGSVATYNCSFGSELLGNATRVCTANGTWSGEEPMCRSLLCPILSNPDNGLVTVNGLTVGSVATYSCNGSYEISGNPTRVCQVQTGVGTWSGSSPTCDLESAVIQVGFTQDSYTVIEGERAAVSYAILSNISLVGDTDFATFNIEVLQGFGSATDGVDFSSVGFPLFGFLDRFTTPRDITVTTIDDTLTEGPEQFVLGLTLMTIVGSFSGNFEVVRNQTTVIIIDDDDDGALLCPILSNPDNGLVTVNGLTVGSVATYSCNGSYEISGNPTRVCQVQTGVGTWSGSSPTCDLESAVIQVGFTQDSYTVTEGDTVTVMYAILSNISLVGDTDFATFNIEVLQGSGSATDDVDFSSVGFPLFGFLDRFTTPRDITVITIDDTLTEGSERFVLGFTLMTFVGSFSGNFEVVRNQTTVIIIDDDDGGLPDPTGAPSGSCSALSPDPTQHGVPPNMSAVPYFLDFNFFRLEDGSFGYIPGNTYTIFLTSTDFNQRFRGFLVQSRQRADDATVLGTFDTTPLFGGPELARTSSCPVNPEGAVTHVNDDEKSGVSLVWTAPSPGSGALWFGFYVVESTTNYWVDQRTAVIAEQPQPPPVDVGFIQESYTVTEGERVILTYSFLSEFVVVNVVTFVVFDIEVIPGTASAFDYSFITTTSFVGNFQTSSTITIPTLADSVLESDEQFTVRINPRTGPLDSSGGTFVFTQTNATVTIVNSNLTQPVNPVIEIGFVQDSYTVTEGDTAILMYSIFSDFSLVNNEFASLIAQFVPLTASVSDYEFSSFPNTLPNVQVSPLTPFLSTQTIAISTHDDSEVEGTEEFEVILRIDPSRTIGNFVITRNVTTVIIRDNDIEIEVSIEQPSYTFTEGDDQLEVCVILAGDLEPTEDISVVLAVSFLPLGIQFTSTLILSLGPTTSRNCGNFRFPDDSEDNGPILLFITASFPDATVNATLGRSIASVELLDDDGVTCPPLDAPDNGSVMLNGMNVGSTATYSCDDSYHLDGLQTRMCQNIGGMGVWSGDPPICEEIIQLGFEQSSYVLMEGSSTEVCLIISAGTIAETFSISIHYSHPIYGSAYYVVTFSTGMGPGNTSCVDVSVMDDEVFNGNQTITLELELPQNLTDVVMLRMSTAYLLVVDNDDMDVDECMMGLDNCDENARCDNTDGGFTCTCLDGFVGDGVMCTAPVGLRFQSDRVSAVEGASADLCIVATNNGDQDVTVSGLIVGPGISCSFSFNAPAMSSTKFTKPVATPEDDILNELAQRSLDVYLQSNDTLTVVADEGRRADIIVVDDEIVKVGFQATEYTFLEDEGSAHICVQLMQGSRCKRPVVVRVYTRECGNGRDYADEGADFEPVWEILSVNINAEQGDLFCFYVNLIDDDDIEVNETFKVFLEVFDINAFALFDRRQASIIIVDDDNITECLSLSSIANGDIMYSPDNTSPFDLGTIATYVCDDGFYLDLSVGSETRTCIEDGNGDRVGVFDGEAPSCVPFCPSLEIGNGTVSIDGFVTGSTANYSCDPFYTLNGNEIRMCQNGTWSGEDPECERDPISLMCSSSSGSPLVLNVGCSAIGPFPIVSTVCNFDSGSRIENCSSGGFSIMFTEFEPGDHVLVITFTDSDGEQASQSFPFTVPPRLDLVCTEITSTPTSFTFQCTSNNNLFQPLSCMVTSDQGASMPVDCGIGANVTLAVPLLELNTHYTLEVTAVDVFEQEDIEMLRFVTGALSLMCSSSSASPLVLNVGCSASGPFPIVSTVCNFDNGSRIENCSTGGFSIMFTEFEPGDHVLVITFTDSDGEQASQSFPFTVPPRLDLVCTEIASTQASFTFQCTSNNNLSQPLSCMVTSDQGASMAVDCEIGVASTLEIPPLEPNTHYTLEVTAVDVFEQEDSDMLDFATGDVPDLVVQFNDDTPEVNGNVVRVSFISNRPLSSDSMCQIVTPTIAHNCDVDGTSGSFTFTGITGSRPRTITITAISTDGQQATLVRGVRSEATGQCTVHLINEGVTVSDTIVEFQISIIGPTPDNRVTGANCILDGGSTLPCPDPLQYPADPGSHTLNIRPIDDPPDTCTRTQALTINYTV